MRSATQAHRLATIRDELKVAAGAVRLCGVVLALQAADSDPDAGLVLLTYVSRSLDAATKELQRLISGGGR